MVKLNEMQVRELLEKDKFPMLIENNMYIIYGTFEEFLNNVIFKKKKKKGVVKNEKIYSIW